MAARARRAASAIAVVGALTLAAPPASASRGGHAEATGVTAVVGEVGLEVTTTGVVDGLAPLADRLSAGPVVAGRQVDAVRAGTPAEPHGTVSDSLGPVWSARCSSSRP